MIKLNAEYYISQRTKLLKGFDKIAKRTQKCLINRYEEDFAKVIIAETREKVIGISFLMIKQNSYVFQ